MKVLGWAILAIFWGRGRCRQPLWNHNWLWLWLKPICDSTQSQFIGGGWSIFFWIAFLSNNLQPRVGVVGHRCEARYGRHRRNLQAIWRPMEASWRSVGGHVAGLCSPGWRFSKIHFIRGGCSRFGAQVETVWRPDFFCYFQSKKEFPVHFREFCVSTLV